MFLDIDAGLGWTRCQIAIFLKCIFGVKKDIFLKS